MEIHPQLLFLPLSIKKTLIESLSQRALSMLMPLQWHHSNTQTDTPSFVSKTLLFWFKTPAHTPACMHMCFPLFHLWAPRGSASVSSPAASHTPALTVLLENPFTVTAEILKPFPEPLENHKQVRGKLKNNEKWGHDAPKKIFMSRNWTDNQEQGLTPHPALNI